MTNNECCRLRCEQIVNTFRRFKTCEAFGMDREVLYEGTSIIMLINLKGQQKK